MIVEVFPHEARRVGKAFKQIGAPPLVSLTLYGTRKHKTLPVVNGRCPALVGEIGKHTACGVYESRGWNCRGFMPGNSVCIAHRIIYGVDKVKDPGAVLFELGVSPEAVLRALDTYVGNTEEQLRVRRLYDDMLRARVVSREDHAKAVKEKDRYYRRRSRGKRAQRDIATEVHSLRAVISAECGVARD